ncbi:unnamed protein product [Staurois parvus]|uniref:Uncharacterized protein n=1 Tax=Staurois parvus TaxID=386267 RepID=A0ABN9BAD0_9NEOB|nr:unnamed protein product [Staurois parvus]
MEDTEWRPVEGLAEGGEETEWGPVEGLADTEWWAVKGLVERGGRYRTVSKVDESGSSIHDRTKRG